MPFSFFLSRLLLIPVLSGVFCLGVFLTPPAVAGSIHEDSLATMETVVHHLDEYATMLGCCVQYSKEHRGTIAISNSLQTDNGRVDEMFPSCRIDVIGHMFQHDLMVSRHIRGRSLIDLTGTIVKRE